MSRRQALARYLLDHPEAVRARRVLDFASGSGLVAIAAAIPGAAEVHACDIDRFAIAAIRINAAANRSAWLPSKTDLVWDARDAVNRLRRRRVRDALLAGEVC